MRVVVNAWMSVIRRRLCKKLVSSDMQSVHLSLPCTVKFRGGKGVFGRIQKSELSDMNNREGK